jgi:hypothetical protein
MIFPFREKADKIILVLGIFTGLRKIHLLIAKAVIVPVPVSCIDMSENRPVKSQFGRLSAKKGESPPNDNILRILDKKVPGHSIHIIKQGLCHDSEMNEPFAVFRPTA